MYIDVNHARLFFDVYGSKLNITKDTVIEKPTVIILHGGHGFADHTLYVEFWSQFADIAQVIFLDQRGCGRSDAGKPDQWNLQYWADDVYEFCQKLGIKTPIIAGVSMGGHVICELIKHHPEFPGALIFCNTEAKFPLDIVCKKLEKMGGDKPANACYQFYTNPTESTLEVYMRLCVPYYAKNAYTLAELNRCIKNTAVFLHFCQQQMLTFNYLEDLKKIQCPTLLLVGEESLHVVEAADEMAAKIDKKFLSMKLFHHAGAPVYKDAPQAAYDVVQGFLRKIS